MTRVYLDHNATTPLRPEARAAMLRAMDCLGNPSSVHAEGRAAKGLVETARHQVADLVGCRPEQVVFTSGATEAAALAVAQTPRFGGVFLASPTEHPCLFDWMDVAGPAGSVVGLQTAASTQFANQICKFAKSEGALVAVSAANSETGHLCDFVAFRQELEPEVARTCGIICDITQAAGKIPVALGAYPPAFALLSAHKLGGPKGVGALINVTQQDLVPVLRGGGQELGRRSGTENVFGIAGFGAAAAAAKRDVEAGLWDRVAELRNILESGLEAHSKDTTFVAQGRARLPNTSCLIAPQWKGETQVMQMDLAGFAVSSGSACSSGKVKPSRVLQALGYSEAQAACSIRVSLGLDTTQDEVLRFVEAWSKAYKKHKARRAA